FVCWPTQVRADVTAGTLVSKVGGASVSGVTTNNALAPAMTLPAVGVCGPAYSSANGLSGTYSYNQGTGDLTLSGANNATLAAGTYCFHNLALTNSGQLQINGTVVIRLTGTLSIGNASSLNNMTGIPGNLRILSSYAGANGVLINNGAGNV